MIRNLEIENYKSIRHQKIEGCSRINVFIGYPNVGKSNIIEALSLLSYLKESNLSLSELVRVRAFSELFFDGNVNKSIEIKAVKDNLRFKKDEVQLWLTSNNSIEIELKGDDSDDHQTIRHLSVYTSDQKPTSGFNSLKDFESDNVRPYRYAEVEEKGIDPQYRSLYFPYGQNLPYIIEQNSDLRKEVIEMLATYNLKLLFDKSNGNQMKVMKILSDETVVSIPFYQIADTLRRLIFYKAAIKTNENTVLLFEEPEAHMFPPYIRKFTADVMFDKTNQFFIATHSPYVLDTFLEDLKEEELSVYLVDYKKGETLIKRLEDSELNEIREFGVDLFFNLEGYLKDG